MVAKTGRTLNGTVEHPTVVTTAGESQRRYSLPALVPSGVGCIRPSLRLVRCVPRSFRSAFCVDRSVVPFNVQRSVFRVPFLVLRSSFVDLLPNVFIDDADEVVFCRQPDNRFLQVAVLE